MLLSAYSPKIPCTPGVSTCRAEQKLPPSVQVSAHSVCRSQRTAWCGRSTTPCESRSQRGILRVYAEPKPCFIPKFTSRRAISRNLETCQRFFALTALSSFHLQGFSPPGDGPASPRTFLPCCSKKNSAFPASFEGLHPPRSVDQPQKRPHLCPLGVLPFEALPPAAVEPTSRLILSRASFPGKGRRAPQSFSRQQVGFRPWLKIRTSLERPALLESPSRTGPYEVSHLTPSHPSSKLLPTQVQG